MEDSACFLIVVSLAAFLAHTIVQAQDQSGFISLDCGAPKDTSYTERTTNISYISDVDFIDTGIAKSIKKVYTSGVQQQMWTLRSFPEGSRNCYTLKLTQGDKYLIRASFMYGNYDGLNNSPSFELHLGPNLWTAVDIINATTSGTMQIIHVVSSDRLQICLVKSGETTPFISSLELRKLPNTTYNSETGSLELLTRWDVGSIGGQTFRYGIDPFDRAWTPYNFMNWLQITTNDTVDIENSYRPPEIIMKTASIPKDPDAPLKITLTGADSNMQFYLFLHFAEIQKLKPNDTREFHILVNGQLLYGWFRPNVTSTIYTSSSVKADANGQCEISLMKTGNSTLPPLLNAIEIYTVNFLEQAETDEKDVDAMLKIKAAYGVTKDSWQGDPCAPRVYSWEGLNCTYEDTPKITSLNLSSAGLTGKIIESILDLSRLEILDLSNNNLTGPIPSFLADMDSLKVINLSGNKLNGSIPIRLLDKSESGSLTLNTEGNLGVCGSASCENKKKSTAVVPIVASIASVLVLAAALAAFLILKKKKQKKQDGVSYAGTGTTLLHSSSSYQPTESLLVNKNRKFTYADVLKMTNNFQRVLGKGGFGVVYYGSLDNSPVAVKMLAQTSIQGYKQFKAEVELLLRVHHKNLTSLVGYCEDGEKLALIYEFMANGDLKEHLTGQRGPSVLTWEGRLRIAVESAQGLEYLHNGCKPQIVHRDVKTTNILLNELFQAKLADFGLSRSFPVGNETHVSTVVAGTPGYLDPEYYRTNWLTEKSDVYSFGVALLEIITNKPVIDQMREKPHLGEWVGLMLSRGDINNIVDPKLQGDFDPNTVWKAVEVAMASVNPVSARRPTMTQVVMELNEALASEVARNQGSRVTNTTNDSSIELTMNFTTDLSPGAR